MWEGGRRRPSGPILFLILSPSFMHAFSLQCNAINFFVVLSTLTYCSKNATIPFSYICSFVVFILYSYFFSFLSLFLFPTAACSSLNSFLKYQGHFCPFCFFPPILVHSILFNSKSFYLSPFLSCLLVFLSSISFSFLS